MLGIQFGLLQYRSIFVSRVSDRDRNFFVSCRFCVALLRFFAPPRKYLPTPKEFSRRIAAIICSAIDFFSQKSKWKIKIAKYSRMCANRHVDQISKWIMHIFFVCEKISSFMVSINRKQEENIARNQGHFENTNNYQRYIVLHSGTIEYQENSVWRRSRLDLQRRVFRTMSYTIWAPQIFYLMKRKRKEDLQVNLWDFSRQSDDMMSEFWFALI